MEGRVPPPPSAVLLGWELVSIDPDAGTIEVAFAATDQFLNPAGVIQGGFVAAMLDDTMGPALVATLGRGRVVRRGKDVAFLAGELADDSGQIVAVATATAQIRAMRVLSHPAA